ncbi:OPT oligopeptide transporter protein-domain-containing protein [Abortiporus biennis]|nr:OPT oligopeptide transporter protein-domain-containing protein [Abortiporus biennis]
MDTVDDRAPSYHSSRPSGSLPDFFDPNIDPEAAWLEDDSPYPEVRSAVANYDDPDMPVTTLRAWVIGLCWAMIIPGVNQFFYMRYPTIVVSNLVAQLVSFPMGRAWARFMPRIRIFGISLNPGPFTIKEHVLLTIMAGVGYQSAYATEVIAVQRVYYDQPYGFSYQWMLVMSTQMIGFSVGGVARRLLVSPASMIWPNTLVICALYNTLHSQNYVGIGQRRGLSRERFFTYAFLAASIWYIVPGYLFSALRYRSGMGFSLLSFDWNQIAFIGSPLATPWWAEANVVVGFFIFYWILTPILYFKNVWYGSFMPISSLGTFDRHGEHRCKPYDVSRIIFSNATFNVDAYKEYSPLFLSTAFAVSYGLSFASISATIVHAALYFRKPIFVHLRRSLKEQPDIHAQLMARYRQGAAFFIRVLLDFATLVFGIVSIKVWPTPMPIWALCVALIIALFYVIPIGMIQAVTNRQVGLNVITELIAGYALPGKPVAMMIRLIFVKKTWGYISVFQALTFTQDFKLGHYMKIASIPPRSMFFAQVIASVVAGTTQIGVLSWMFSNVPDLCMPTQRDGFTCANTQVFYSASVVWGVVGPKLQFSPGQIYQYVSTLLYFFIAGAVLPIVFWALAKRYPNTCLNYVKLIFAALGLIPPATAVNYIPWAIIGFLFQYLIRRRYYSFWAKYNYVLSAAIDAGTAVSTILVYFCLQYPQNGNIGSAIRSWWGNTVYRRTADWNATPLRTLAAGETFGYVHLSLTYRGFL